MMRYGGAHEGAERKRLESETMVVSGLAFQGVIPDIGHRLAHAGTRLADSADHVDQIVV